jgi:hypothetical protein
MDAAVWGGEGGGDDFREYTGLLAGLALVIAAQHVHPIAMPCAAEDASAELGRPGMLGPCSPPEEENKCTLGGVIGVVVIGEEMLRIKSFAIAHGAGFYDPPPGPPYLWLNNNMEWITEVMDQHCTIWDSGPMRGRSNYPSPTSAYYFQEKALIGLRG